MRPWMKNSSALLRNNMVWKGVILEESLEDKSLLDFVKICRTEREHLEGENRFMTFHKFELADNNKDKFLEKALISIKKGFYLHLCNKGIMYVIFRGHMFKFSKGYPELDCARKYGKSIGIPEEQMPFEHLINNPWE
jgi:hypothetical protein